MSSSWYIDLCEFLNTAAGQVSFGVGLSGSPDVRTRYFTKDGNAFPSFVWNALERILERVRNAFGTRSERKWNANGTRSERVPDAFRTQMERERSVRLFLSSTVYS